MSKIRKSLPIIFLLAVISIVIDKTELSKWDIIRYVIFPGMASGFAAWFGAKAGATAHIESNRKELAEAYIGLLDLIGKDIERNKEIFKRVKNDANTNSNIYPELAHIMFFEDIKYPDIRKLVSRERLDDIFHVRNICYCYTHWNNLVAAYYGERDHIIQKHVVMNHNYRDTIANLVTTEQKGNNYINACDTAIEAIERIKKEIKSRHNLIISDVGR